MNDSLVEDTRRRLHVFHGHYPSISRDAGLSYSWLTKFAQGRVPNPTMRNLETLRAELDRREADAPTGSAANPTGPVTRKPAMQASQGEDAA